MSKGKSLRIQKKGTRKWSEAKSFVQGEKQFKKWNKESGDLKEIIHPAKFPTCVEELRRSLELVCLGTLSISAVGRLINRPSFKIANLRK